MASNNITRQTNTASLPKNDNKLNFNFNTHINQSQRTQYPQIKRNKDDFFIFSQKKDFVGVEVEKLQEEILRLKKENNRKDKEINSLKSELNNLSNEDKKKLKIIEDILSSSGKSYDEIVSILEGKSKAEKMDLSATSIIRLREVYVINFLKSQIGQLKGLLSERENEIIELKNNTKVTKMSQMENECKFLQFENDKTKEELKLLIKQNEVIDKGFKELQYEHQMLYKRFLKKEREVEKNSAIISKMEEDNKSLVVEKRRADESTNKYRLDMINMKTELKYKTDLCNNSKSIYDDKEKFEKEKELLNKKITELKKDTAKYKLDIKLLNKQVDSLKEALELEQCRNKQIPKPQLNAIEKKRDSKIKSNHSNQVIANIETISKEPLLSENSTINDKTKTNFYDVPKDKQPEFKEEDLDKYDDDFDGEDKEKNDDDLTSTHKTKKERPKNSKYKENIDLNETTGGFFKTSVTNEGKSQAQINREKEIAADTNLIEEGSECEDADLSKEIAKLEGRKDN